MLADADPCDTGLVEPEPVDAIAAAVLAVPGVHALHAGIAGEVATYLPGRRVNGVMLGEHGCSIHVVLRWGVPVIDTTDAVRDAARPYVPGPVDVTVEDILAPDAGSAESDRFDTMKENTL